MTVLVKVDLIEGFDNVLASSMRVIGSSQTVTQLLLESCEKHGVVLDGGADACRAYLCRTTPTAHSNPVLIDKECWDQFGTRITFLHSWMLT